MAKAKRGTEREEVRGIFVLGIIATLLSIAQVAPKLQLPFGVPFVDAMYWLIVYWGSYLVFAVIGISRDWIRQSVAEWSYEFSSITFVGGMGILVALVTLVVIGSVLPFQIGYVWSLLIAGIFAAAFIYAIRKPGWKKFTE